MADAKGDIPAGAVAGSAVRIGDVCGDQHHAVQLASGAGFGAAAGAVLDRADVAVAAIARPPENRLWRKKLCDIVVSGFVDRAIVNRGCRAVAGAAGAR